MRSQRYVERVVWNSFTESHVDISATLSKPYKVDDETVNQELELKHGESTRRFPMDKISNGRFEPVLHTALAV